MLNDGEMHDIGKQECQSNITKSQGSSSLDMTDEEINAVMEKLDSPERVVICPRCGNVLLYEEFGSSAAAKCITQDCIHGSVRGF